MAIRGDLDQIAGAAERDVEHLYNRRTAGSLSQAEFEARSAATIDRANAKATAAADRGVAMEAAKKKHQPTRPTGIRPKSEQPRIQKEVHAATTKGPATPKGDAARKDKVGRLAHREPFEAAQKAIPKAARAQGSTGWVRETNEGACELCTGWDDGKVRSYDVEMARHKGCQCLQRPQFKEERQRRPDRRRLSPSAKAALSTGAVVVVASPLDDILIGGALVKATGGRTRVLSGGRVAHTRLQRMEKLLKEGGVKLAEMIAKKEALVAAGVKVDRNSRDLAVLQGTFIDQRDIYAFVDNLEAVPYTQADVDALWEYAGVHPLTEQEVIDFPNVASFKGPVTRYNEKLRDRVPLTTFEQETIAAVDAAINRNRTSRDITVYRGARLSITEASRIHHLARGEVLLDESYMFTGLTEERALPHAMEERKVRSRFGFAEARGMRPRDRVEAGAPGETAVNRLRPAKAPRTVFGLTRARPDLIADLGIGDIERLFNQFKEEDSLVSVLFEIEVPKGTPAIASPYGLALGRGAKIPLALGRLPFVPAKHQRKTGYVRVPFLRYFNKEELVLPRRTPLRMVSSELRSDGVLVVRMEATPSVLGQPLAPGLDNAAIVAMAGKKVTPPPRIAVPRPTALTKAGPQVPGVGPVMAHDLIEDVRVLDTIRRQTAVPGFQDLARRTSRATLDVIVRRMADFILAAAERSMALSPEATIRHANWYPFAHDWINGLADANNRFGITRQGAYAATAALSPGADWADNVAWAKRLIEAMAKADKIKVKKEWIDERYRLAYASWEASVANAKTPKIRARKLANPPVHRTDLIGRTLKSIADDPRADFDSDDSLATVMRGWHDVDPVHQLGGTGGFGDPGSLTRPQSQDNLVKAIKVLRDGSLENIDATLGGQKVRSFYNNLANPLDRDDLNVTIDTHHFGVANGFPWSVSHKFLSSGSTDITNTPWSGTTGVGGTYSMVVSATRIATDAFNERYGTHYLPNQLQSIVWEQHRAEYPPGMRSAAKKGDPIPIMVALEKIRTDRARGRITWEQEAELVEEARLRLGGPTQAEMLEWFRLDLANLPRPTLKVMRDAAKRKAKGK